MSGFWRHLARFAAKRAGGHYVRTVQFGRPSSHPDLFDLDAVKDES